MKQTIVTVILLILLTHQNAASQCIYTPEDSIRIESILKEIDNKCKSGKAVIATAHTLLGTPYVGGTLDTDISRESLIVNISEVDCTTFVEQILALVLSGKEEKRDFSTFRKNLELIRYRNGRCNGYASRLHYITQWIADSAKLGVITEVVTAAHTATQQLSLNFMSSHSNSYPQLKGDTSLIAQIERYEKPFRNISVRYIPKESLCKGKEQLEIEDGDVLALVTAIEGLDVTHVGFAFWKNGKLHLLHASSAKKEVIADTESLYDYMKEKKNHLGVRVFRIIGVR